MAEYTVAHYIVDRLSALGVQHLFSVPGNYTAQFLETAQKSKRIACIGTTCELEAGYAADAYARMKRVGVACVTYGVGSMSLYNAIAGAWVEWCPVVLINGTANADKMRLFRQQGVLFAHAIDTLRTDEYVFRPVCAATAVILNAAEAPAQIDHVLRSCITESRPVYLEVPDGVWDHACVPPADPETPLTSLPLTAAQEEDVKRATAAAVEAVWREVARAKHPVLWGGELLQRRHVEDEFEALVSATGWAYTTTLLGKSVISERNPRFIGVYDSKFAAADVAAVVEGTDCLIALGTILSDFYGPIVQKHYDGMILASNDAVRIGRALYPNVPFDRFVRALRDRALARRDATASHSPPAGLVELRQRRQSSTAAAMELVMATQSVTWDSFFGAMREFVMKGMHVLVDTSLALFPSAEILIEERGHFVAQTAWLSIGYTTGGSVGASFAAKEGEQVVALVGDGGFQMLPQFLSTLAAHERPAIVFLLNNGLYGVEQYLVDKKYYAPGSTQEPNFFNRLARWDYVKLAESFGATGVRVTSMKQLNDALAKIRTPGTGPVLVDVVLAQRDLPAEIRATIEKAPGVARTVGDRAGFRIASAAFD